MPSKSSIGPWRLDPNYGKAYAARGEAYWRDYQATKQAKWVEKASQDCNRAVSLGNAGADGHLCLGLVAAGTGKYQDAANEYQTSSRAGLHKQRRLCRPG